MTEAFDSGTSRRLKLNGKIEHHKGMKCLVRDYGRGKFMEWDFGIIINPKGHGLAD